MTRPGTTVLTEAEINLLRTLRTNDRINDRLGLTALAINASSERLGHPVDMRVGDIHRLVASLRDRGLVRPAESHRGRTTFRLTAAGLTAIAHIPDGPS